MIDVRKQITHKIANAIGEANKTKVLVIPLAEIDSIAEAAIKNVIANMNELAVLYSCGCIRGSLAEEKCL